MSERGRLEALLTSARLFKAEQQATLYTHRVYQ